LTVVVLNKDPGNMVQTQFTVNGFTPHQVTSYTLSSTNQTKIEESSTNGMVFHNDFAPYTATLFVVSGTFKPTAAEWDLNPDTIMVAAGGKVVLHPKITSGSGTVTLGTPQSDSGITLTITQPTLGSGKNGSITVTAGAIPGFYHFAVPSSDSAGGTQQQGGWIVVGNPAASLTKTGDNQKGPAGSKLNLSVTLNAGQSGCSAGGGTIFFTTTVGSLSSRTVTTDSSGKAAVVLTLPSAPGTVHVTAEGQFALGHPVVTFTETAQWRQVSSR